MGLSVCLKDTIGFRSAVREPSIVYFFSSSYFQSTILHLHVVFCLVFLLYDHICMDDRLAEFLGTIPKQFKIHIIYVF